MPLRQQIARDRMSDGPPYYITEPGGTTTDEPAARLLPAGVRLSIMYAGMNAGAGGQHCKECKLPAFQCQHPSQLEGVMPLPLLHRGVVMGSWYRHTNPF